MTPDLPISQFAKAQQKLLSLCGRQFGRLSVQFHPELSPMGWHLGHCVFTDYYWIQQQLLGVSVPSKKLQSIYAPELLAKHRRGENLPEDRQLLIWAKKEQQKNNDLIRNFYEATLASHELMQNSFLLYFLIQHYGQHRETLHMILVQQLLSSPNKFTAQQPLRLTDPDPVIVTLPAGRYAIGGEQKAPCYDNEYPNHKVQMNAVAISNRLVSNGEYYAFMQDMGYQSSCYWSGVGWEWCKQYNITHPAYWRQDARKNWFGTDINGPYDLIVEAPVWGISYYEAQAFATWAGARLPHEYEWEAAKKSSLLEGAGQVWEWCINDFHPYEGFSAFPYIGYSVPYFDGSHYVLKGGSIYTENIIKRASFRNYYQPDKRHHFAGCRLVFT